MGPISLNAFASFVNEARSNGLKQNQRVVLAEEDSSKTVENMTDQKPLKIIAGDSDFPEARHITMKGGRQAAQNNLIRAELLKALKVYYGVNTVLELPKSIRKALKFRLLADDMWIKDGKVTSGRPLTLRRIKAVLAAVKKERLKSENKVFNCKASGCAGYHLFNEADANNRSFKDLVGAYSQTPNSDTLPNFFKMLADAASFLTKKGDRKMLGGSYNLKQLNMDVSDLEGSMVGLEMSNTIKEMQKLIKNGYAKWSEDTRKDAIWRLMAGSYYLASPNAHEIDPLRNMLRDENAQSHPTNMTEEKLPKGLQSVKSKLETAWEGANSKEASLEQQLANDMLRYVIDFWLKDEVKG